MNYLNNQVQIGAFQDSQKKQITNVVTTETWKHDQLVGIMRKTSWDIEHGRTSKLQMENPNSFPISKLQDISNGTLCLFNLNHVYYLHFCPKHLKHYKTPTFKVNLTLECLGYTYFALSQLVRMCLSLRTLFLFISFSLCHSFAFVPLSTWEHATL